MSLTCQGKIQRNRVKTGHSPCHRRQSDFSKDKFTRQNAIHQGSPVFCSADCMKLYAGDELRRKHGKMNCSYFIFRPIILFLIINAINHQSMTILALIKALPYNLGGRVSLPQKKHRGSERDTSGEQMIVRQRGPTCVHFPASLHARSSIQISALKKTTKMIHSSADRDQWNN